MSTGSYDDKPASLELLNELLKKHADLRKFIAKKRPIIRTYDIPYLGGISEDGETIYKDRHLPKDLRYKGAIIQYDDYLARHEALEYWLVKHLGYKYERAHHLATAGEKEKAGDQWKPYRMGLRPFYRPTEHERIKSVPRDLATYAYTGALLKHMKKVMEKSQ